MMEVNECAKEKVGLGHVMVVNDGVNVDEKVSVMVDLVRHMIRGSVAEVGGNRKVINHPDWRVLPTNGRLDGEDFQGCLE